jgi:hypothetical protein
MIIVFDESRHLYEAMQIAVGYLVSHGYSVPEARLRSAAHIRRLINTGEERPIALANRAIILIEQEERFEEELHEMCDRILFE